MATTVTNIIKLAQSWIGKKESDGSHKEIIDIYNAHKPLARGYKVKYTDSWCATFISALAIKSGATDIISTECGCSEMIELCKSKGIWVENDAHTPKAGDIIFYDWQDNGKGDNTGWSDHVGIVEKVSSKTITVIEGNYGDSVKRRNLQVNGQYIRGYGVPKYAAEQAVAPATTRDYLMKGDKGAEVKTMQEGLIKLGYDLGKYGADGDFGGDTDKAVRKFQKDYKLTVDGKYGKLSKSALEKAVAAKKEIKVGNTVKVKKGAKTFTGGNLASFVYERNHKVKEINVDRVVITYNGIVVAAVRKSDLTLVD